MRVIGDPGGLKPSLETAITHLVLLAGFTDMGDLREANWLFTVRRTLLGPIVRVEGGRRTVKSNAIVFREFLHLASAPWQMKKAGFREPFELAPRPR